MKPKTSKVITRPLTASPKIDGDAPPESRGGFPIVAIGASAGGLEAVTEMARHLPPKTGMAYVLIQHLDPTHHSMLTELIARETRIPVVEVKSGMAIEPDHFYVIPPNATMSVGGRTLQLSPREGSPGQYMPIDSFMRSLAQDQGSNSIGVILSGSGSDGTLGMAEIQAQGGVTFAQDESTAKYDSMPRSAISAGYIDLVLPPQAIALELSRIASHPYARPSAEPGGGGTLYPKTVRASTPFFKSCAGIPASILPPTAAPPSTGAFSAAWSCTR